MREEDREGHVRGFYEAEAASYDDRRWHDPAGLATHRVHIKVVRELLAKAPPGPFLELGIGTGRFGATLANAERPCFGLDISRNMLARAAARGQEEGTGGHLALVQASGGSLPFATGSIGACLSVNVLSHLPDPPATVAELGRVIRPGGVFLANWPNAQSPYVPYTLAVRLTGRSLLRGVLTNHYTPREIRALLGRNGFEIEDIRGHLAAPWARLGPLLAVLSGIDAAMRRGWPAWWTNAPFLLARRVG